MFQPLDACSGVESWHAVEFMLRQLITTEQWSVNWLLFKEITCHGHAQQKQTVLKCLKEGLRKKDIVAFNL